MNSGNPSANDIVVLVEYDGQQHELHTYANEYRSLMMLIYDRIFSEGFGECLGLGKCGTCLVEITGKRAEPTAYERNENINLAKTGHTCANVRLACQLMIDEKMDGLAVKVLI